MKTIFLRVLEAEDKAGALLAAVGQDGPPNASSQRFEVDPSSFGRLPGSVFAYWARPSALACYRAHGSLASAGFEALSTNQLSDDNRYARLWWEIEPSTIGNWVTWAKGRTFAPYHYDIQTLVRWNRSRGTYTGFLGTKDRPLEKPASADWFFRPGLTWPRRTSGLSVSILPGKSVFGNKGPAIFAPRDDESQLLTLLAVLNSTVFRYLLSLQLARVELAQSFEVGLVQATPIPRGTLRDTALASLAGRAWALRNSLDSRSETSHAFSVPALLQTKASTSASRVAEWNAHVRAVETELGTIHTEVDERSFALYEIADADRPAISDSFGSGVGVGQSTNRAQPRDAASEDDDDLELAADTTAITAELLSWAVGVAFGRFDVRLATGARPLPDEPEPFDPLPGCSPGMLTGTDGLPVARPPKGYPHPFPDAGVLVDDPGYPLDLTQAVRAVFDVVFAADADRWWQEVSALLDPKGHDLRTWLAGSFFELHLKRYSKSRRKAPIYWQLSTTSGRYSVWLYAHRLTRDTLLHVQNDVVGPKLSHEERRLSDLTQTAGGSPSARDRKEIAAQDSFVEELRGLLAEVKRVAPLFAPDLDDGIVLVSAPLWRLVPGHKAWQKEVKSKWDELCAGDYDWAHLAMHLWPERVVPKCAKDRSLAIAHGLEDIFWEEGKDGKWQARPLPARPIEEIVRERTSPAVKAALAGLLEAGATGGGAGKKKRKARGDA